MYTLIFIKHDVKSVCNYSTYEEAKNAYDYFVRLIKDNQTDIIGVVLKDYNEGTNLTYDA